MREGVETAEADVGVTLGTSPGKTRDTGSVLQPPQGMQSPGRILGCYHLELRDRGFVLF